MLVYMKKNGYGNVNIDEARMVIDLHLPSGHRDKVTLMSLLYDYEVLRGVIEGKSVFRHEDGSETRRIKLY